MKRIMTILVCTVLTSVAFANEVNKLFEEMSEDQRKDAFAYLLNSSGKECDKAHKIFMQGMDKEQGAFWNISCLNGKSYSVRIANDARGSTRIFKCDVLDKLGRPCFRKLGKNQQ